MRSTRFGAIAQRKNNGYIWDVYNITYGYSQAGTDKFTGMYTSKRKTVDSISKVSISETGFMLLNASSTELYNIAHLYFVSLTDSNVSSGNTLYFADSVKNSGTYAIVSYTSYVVTPQKGDTLQGQVTDKDINAYPANGEQDGHWYVLIT